MATAKKSGGLPARLAGGWRRRSEARLLSPMARKLREANLTYLAPLKLRNIEWALDRIERDRVPGDLLEAGVALGGSAILIAQHSGPERRFHGYDVFGMIPAPGPDDPPSVHERYEVIRSGQSKGIGGDTYYGYRDHLYDEVVASFARFGPPVDGERVSLHKGPFEETLHPAGPVALAHIDCDWYEPVCLCLERIHARLSPGGFLVIDDYYDYESAARAVDEFLAEHPDVLPVERTPGRHRLLRREAS